MDESMKMVEDGDSGAGARDQPRSVVSARCRRNLLRIGHCAPSVMRTLLEERERPDLEMVKVAGGLAGGIGGPGECGGVVAPLMMLGLLLGDDPSGSRVLRFVALGREHLRCFRQLHGSTKCKDIGSKGLGACFKAMCCSPGLFADVFNKEAAVVEAMPEATKVAHEALFSAFKQKQFHCAQDVLRELRDVTDVTDDMRRASFCFVGGMVLTGSTCGALAAGVMAISAKLGGVEDSPMRVLRMIATMIVSPKLAMRDEGNAANRAIRIASTLAEWFQTEYGTTTCAELTRADFDSLSSVEKFCEEGLPVCRARVCRVAAEAKRLMAEG